MWSPLALLPGEGAAFENRLILNEYIGLIDYYLRLRLDERQMRLSFGSGYTDIDRQQPSGKLDPADSSRAQTIVVRRASRCGVAESRYLLHHRQLALSEHQPKGLPDGLSVAPAHDEDQPCLQIYAGEPEASVTHTN